MRDIKDLRDRDWAKQKKYCSGFTLENYALGTCQVSATESLLIFVKFLYFKHKNVLISIYPLKAVSKRGFIWFFDIEYNIKNGYNLDGNETMKFKMAKKTK